MHAPPSEASERGDRGTDPGRAPAGAEAEAAARFRLFALAHALATVLYHRWSWLDPEPATLPLVAALAVLVRPGSRACFALLVALQAVFAYLDLPGANTNRTLMVLVAATLLGAWVVARARAARTPSAAGWQRALEPALRWELLLVYAWAAWHKLNPDYLDLETSCAVQLYLKVVERAPLPLPAGPLALHAAVYGSLLVEAALPPLLLARRTRLAGLALAAMLHFVFGLTMFYDFSMSMLALLTLFLPPGFALQLEASLPGRRARAGSPLVRGLCVALLALAGELVFWDLYDAFALAWWGLAPVLLWFAWRLRVDPGPLPPARELMRTPAALAPFPLLVFLNGLCPYVGSKTETAFAMYSNLRTEGGRTNHLLVPRPLALFGYQTDLARVLSSSDPELQALAESGHPVPFFTLRRRVSELADAGIGGVRLVYVRNGRTLDTEAAERDPELARPPSAFELRFLRFRTILPPDANACSH